MLLISQGRVPSTPLSSALVGWGATLGRVPASGTASLPTPLPESQTTMTVAPTTILRSHYSMQRKLPAWAWAVHMYADMTHTCPLCSGLGQAWPGNLGVLRDLGATMSAHPSCLGGVESFVTNSGQPFPPPWHGSDRAPLRLSLRSLRISLGGLIPNSFYNVSQPSQVGGTAVLG